MPSTASRLRRSSASPHSREIVARCEASGSCGVGARRYMGALVATRRNPVIRAFYHRLVAAGKPKNLALTACKRKLLTILNAMMRSNTTWRQISQSAYV